MFFDNTHTCLLLLLFLLLLLLLLFFFLFFYFLLFFFLRFQKDHAVPVKAWRNALVKIHRLLK